MLKTTPGTGMRFDQEHFAKLDSRDRLVWQDPAKLIGWLNLRGGETVVDIGAGTGFISLPLARQLPGITVYAVDVSRKLQDILKERAAAENLVNIHSLLTDGRKIALKDGSANMVLLVNVLHELGKDRQLLGECRRVLKSGGRLVLVDWKKETASVPFGPPLTDRIDFAEASAELNSYGFKLNKTLDMYPYHYTAVFLR